MSLVKFKSITVGDTDTLDLLSTEVEATISVSSGKLGISTEYPSEVLVQQLGDKKLLIGISPDAVLTDASSSIDLINAAIEALTFQGSKVGEVDLSVWSKTVQFHQAWIKRLYLQL